MDGTGRGGAGAQGESGAEEVGLGWLLKVGLLFVLVLAVGVGLGVGLGIVPVSF